MTDDHIDFHKLAAEIEAEVRARRAAGEYPPGFERELDRMFDRFAPAEVSTDFDTAFERAEDLMIIDPEIPVASRSPVLGVVKRVMSKLIGWYHVWLTQQIAAIASAVNTALRLLGGRIVELEHVTGDLTRARVVGARIPALHNTLVSGKSCCHGPLWTQMTRLVPPVTKHTLEQMVCNARFFAKLLFREGQL